MTTTQSQSTSIRVTATVTVRGIAVDGRSMDVDASIPLLAGDQVQAIDATGTVGHTGDAAQWTPAGDGKGKADGMFAFGSVSSFGLGGWIGDDKAHAFPVAPFTPFAVGAPGGLHLAFNDHDDHQGKYANNTGAFTASVRYVRTFPIHAEGSGDAAAAQAWGVPLVTLHTGDTVEITATGKARFWGDGDWTGPDGATGRNGDLLAPGIDQRALVGRIGEGGAPFRIGSAHQGQAATAGGLFVSVNDMVRKPGAYTNNDGAFELNLLVTRAG